MTDFIETRLLDESISWGTQLIPSNGILRFPLRSGIVRRKRIRRSIREYAIICKLLKPAEQRSVINAFVVCDGGQGFRFFDRTDYKVVNQVLTVGTGAEQVIQLFKNYSFGTETRQRPIRKPVAGTTIITADTPPTDVSIDTTTGMATFTATLGEIVRFSCEFDVPVMFADDRMVAESITTDENGDLMLSTDVGLIEDLGA